MLLCGPAFSQHQDDEFQAKSAPVQFEDVEVLDQEAYKPKPIDTTMSLAVIAFGSCNKIDKPQADPSRVRTELPALMAGVAELKVPLLAEVGDGANWDEAH